MFKFLLIIVKKIILGMFLLFMYNTFLSSLNLVIPINLITIILVSLFDAPGIIGLVIFLMINYI